jgi:small subunit ribosomal protein S1
VVSEVNDDNIIVKISNQLKGIIKRNELALDRAEQKTNRFTVGQEISAKVLNHDKSNEVVHLSIKALDLEEQEEAIKTYGSIDSGVTLSSAVSASKESK